MVKMRALEGMKSCGFRGVVYAVRNDGTVEVPTDAVDELKSHGLVVHVPNTEFKREKK